MQSGWCLEDNQASPPKVAETCTPTNMMTAMRTISRATAGVLVAMGHAGLLAADVVNVTIEAEDVSLVVGESTLVRVYGQIDSAEAGADGIFSWYIDVLNDNGAVVGGYASVETPASDNGGATSDDGEPEGANLVGIRDTFLDRPGAGKGERVILVQFEVTAMAAGSATLSVAPGSSGLELSDFLVALTEGGSVQGGNYETASLEFTVVAELDPSALDLNVTVTGGGNTVTFQPIAGYDHTVQYSDTLLAPSWIDVPGAPHNSGAVNHLAAGVPERYYRVKLTAP